MAKIKRRIQGKDILFAWLFCVLGMSTVICYELFKENLYARLILPCIGILSVMLFFHAVMLGVTRNSAKMDKNLIDHKRYCGEICNILRQELNPTTLQNKLDGVDLR